jgi:hypothetical protein
LINESIVKFKYLLEFILKVNNINYQESLSNSDVNDFQIDQKQIIDNDFTYAPIEFNISFLALPKKKLFEIEIKNKNNYKKNIRPKFQLGTKERRTKNKIIKLSVKSMQENLKKEKKNYVYRKDAYYKHFKALFAKYIRNKVNNLKNICFPNFNKNNFAALSYKFTGNPKEKDNIKFLSMKIKDLLILGKDEEIKNRQYNNELLIKYIENNRELSIDKNKYEELISCLDETLENELMEFYNNKIEFENINKDIKCLIFDKHFKNETGISLLEKNGFIKILNKQYQ